MTARVEQVGGTHYQAEYQHWDLVEEADVAYLEATATKYLTRWTKKGGVEDLRKAVTYLEKMDGRGALRRVETSKLAKFICDNSIGEPEATIITLILGDLHGRSFDIALAISLINNMIADSNRHPEDR